MDTKLVFTGIIALSTILKTIISKLIALTMFPLRPNRIWVAIGAAFLQRCIATHLFLSGSIKTPIVLAACASTRSHGVCPWINLDKTLLTKLLLLLWSVKYVELPDSFEVYEVESARKLSPHSVLKLQRADGTRSVQCRVSNIRLPPSARLEWLVNGVAVPSSANASSEPAFPTFQRLEETFVAISTYNEGRHRGDLREIPGRSSLVAALSFNHSSLQWDNTGAVRLTCRLRYQLASSSSYRSTKDEVSIIIEGSFLSK